MNRSRALLTCIFAALLPFATVSVAHGEPVNKSSTIKKAKASKKSRTLASKTRSKSAKSQSIAKNSKATPATAAVASAEHVTATVAAPATEMAAPVAANLYMASAATSNPYLAYRQQSQPVGAQQTPPTQPAAAVVATANPYMGQPQQFEPVNPWNSFGQVASNVKQTLPSFSGEGLSILPKIKTVYPTGEKPLKVITFKCPTELIGVTPPPVKILHEGVNLAMDGLNRSDLLPFNLQQVCM